MGLGQITEEETAGLRRIDLLSRPGETDDVDQRIDRSIDERIKIGATVGCIGDREHAIVCEFPWAVI